MKILTSSGETLLLLIGTIPVYTGSLMFLGPTIQRIVPLRNSDDLALATAFLLPLALVAWMFVDIVILNNLRGLIPMVSLGGTALVCCLNKLYEPMYYPSLVLSVIYLLIAIRRLWAAPSVRRMF